MIKLKDLLNEEWLTHNGKTMWFYPYQTYYRLDISDNMLSILNDRIVV